MFFKKREIWPQTLKVGQYFVYLIASTRAKRMTLRVKASEAKITLTAPPLTPLAMMQDFLNRYSGWVEVRSQKLSPPKLLAHGDILPFKGKALELIYAPLVRGVFLNENTLEIGGEQAGFQRRLHNFLYKEAKMALTQSSERYAAQLNVTIEKITVRDTTSRWGSCSSKGALNYSWRVILAPPEVLDYLCAHEVAHRLEMNHSSRFWAIVERLYPDYEKQEKWLKKHGSKLHQYRV
jgi:predicted metal-dependent hydrolase